MLLNKFKSSIEEEVKVSGFDANQEQEAGFNRVVLETGLYPGYICKYVDLGKQKIKKFGSNETKTVDGCFIGVVVFDYSDCKTPEDNPVQVFIDTGTAFPLNKSLNEKAKFKKIFEALNFNNDESKKHILDFAGNTESYIFKVEKATSKKGKEYNKIILESATPSYTGERGSQKREKLPEVSDKEQSVLLWNAPSLEMWDSLQRGSDDVSAGDPNNFLKYTILNAENFKGSALDHILRDAKIDTKILEKKDEETTTVEEEATEEAEAKPTKTVPDEMPAMPDMGGDYDL